MEKIYTAQIQHRGEWWIGWVREIPGVNCQERTREELLETTEKLRSVKLWNLKQRMHYNQSEDNYEVVKIAV